MSILDPVWQILFPPCCVQCQAPVAWLCPPCLKTWQQQLSTEVVQYPHPDLPIYIAVKDASGILGKLLFAWKYQRYLEASNILQLLWADAFVRLFPSTEGIVLVPIPVHWFKKWQRGFNQAEQLTLWAQSQWQIPSMPLIVRSRYTQTQVGLSKEAREQNVASAFKLDPFYAATLSPNTVIVLVDDIVTSASTLVECCQVLHQAGFHHIVALVLHRGTR